MLKKSIFLICLCSMLSACAQNALLDQKSPLTATIANNNSGPINPDAHSATPVSEEQIMDFMLQRQNFQGMKSKTKQAIQRAATAWARFQRSTRWKHSPELILEDVRLADTVASACWERMLWLSSNLPTQVKALT